MRHIDLPGRDRYAEDNPRGAFNRAMRDNARLAVALQRTQPTGSAAPAGETAAEPRPVADATTEELADAIADAIDRRQRQPTVQESVRDKSRQLLRLTAERDARHVQRAQQRMTGDVEQ